MYIDKLFLHLADALMENFLNGNDWALIISLKIVITCLIIYVFIFLQDEVLRVKDDDNKFEVSIDTHGYKPEDLQVKIKDNVVSIEAKSEEKKDEPNSKSYACKKFARSFTLPQGCKMQSVTSNLSKDGLLIVSAPKVEAVQQTSSRKVPIEMKKF